MKLLPSVVLLINLAAFAHGQVDRRSFEFYRANLEKYLGKEISVHATAAQRKDTGEFGDVALFLVHTPGSAGYSYTYVAVPLAEAKSFSKRYASRNDSYFSDSDMRPLRGKLMKGDLQFANMVVYETGGLYIGFKDAALPENANPSGESQVEEQKASE
jgi:hypothetical protein